jgi:hypothetical protein
MNVRRIIAAVISTAALLAMNIGAAETASAKGHQWSDGTGGKVQTYGHQW